MTSSDTVLHPTQFDRLLMLVDGLGAQVTTAMASRLGSLALTGNHPVTILCALDLEGMLRPRDIQARTGLTAGGTANQLDRLVRDGLVLRTHDTVAPDRRAVAVTLTPAGRSAVDDILMGFSDCLDSVRGALPELLGIVDGTADPSAAPRPGPTRPAVARRELAEALGLMTDFGTHVGAIIAESLGPGVTRSNATAMILGALETGPRRPRELAEAARLDTGSTARLLAELDAQGLVERQHGILRTDGRATVVSLTPAGRRARRAMTAALCRRRGALGASLLEAMRLLGA